MNKKINLEAFRILMAVIKSLRDSGEYTSSGDSNNDDDDVWKIKIYYP